MAALRQSLHHSIPGVRQRARFSRHVIFGDCTTGNKLRLKYNYLRKTSAIGRWTEQYVGIIIAILPCQRSRQLIICHTAREGIYLPRLITNYNV